MHTCVVQNTFVCAYEYLRACKPRLFAAFVNVYFFNVNVLYMCSLLFPRPSWLNWKYPNENKSKFTSSPTFIIKQSTTNQRRCSLDSAQPYECPGIWYMCACVYGKEWFLLISSATNMVVVAVVVAVAATQLRATEWVRRYLPVTSKLSTCCIAIFTFVSVICLFSYFFQKVMKNIETEVSQSVRIKM